MMSENLSKILWQDRRVRATLALALVIRLLFLSYLAIYPSGIFAKGDSKDYLQLAQYLLYYQQFGRTYMGPGFKKQELVAPPAPGERVTLIPETFRTPAYPVFLALTYGVSGSPFPAVVLQSLLFSLLTVWLVMLLMAQLFPPEAAWRAGLLAALEPLGLTYTHELMTESLFLLLMLFGVYVFLNLVAAGPRRKRYLIWAALGGLSIGLAILTRPVASYFPIFLLILWISGGLGGMWQALAGSSAPAEPKPSTPVSRKFPAGVKPVLVFLVVALLPSGLWGVRNFHCYKRFLVSSCPDHVLLANITSHMVAKMRYPEGDVSSWQVFGELERELVAQMAREGLADPSEPEKAAYFRNWSLGFIKNHPGLFLRYYFKGMAILFIPDVPGFFELLGFTQEGKGGLGAVFRQGLRPALSRYFGEHWVLYVAAALPLILYDLAVCGLAGLGLAGLWRARKFPQLFLLLAVIGYWLALAAIGAAPRYRLPLMPFLMMLAAWGWFQLGQGSSVSQV